MINTTISSFGKKLGFDDLSFNEDKVIHLEIETLGDLFIEDATPYLLVYLIKEIQDPSLKVYQKALTLCHYKQKNPYATHVALQDDNQIVFLVQMPHEEISESNLEKSILFLYKLHEQLANIDKS